MTVAKTENIFIIGHSLVSEQLPQMLNSMNQDLGNAGRIDYQIITGAPLGYNWQHAGDAGAVQGHNSREALASGDYGVVVMTEAVPLDPHLEWSDPVGNALNFLRVAHDANPEVQTYFYETWHGFDFYNGDLAAWRRGLDDYLVKWEGIVDKMNEGRPVGSKEMLLVPAGQAMAGLYDAIEAGEIPGISSIRDFFRDDIHPNEFGFYFVSSLYQSVVYGTDVKDIPEQVRGLYGDYPALPGPVIEAVHKVVADTVLEYQRDGSGPVLDDEETPPVIIDEPDEDPDSPDEDDDITAPPPVIPGDHLTAPSLAIGLNGVTDWTTEQPFINVFKTSRPWTGHTEGQWGGLPKESITALLDENGYLTRMPDGATAISALFLTEQPAASVSLAGMYRLTWDGEGQIAMNGVRDVVYGDGEIWFRYEPTGDNLVAMDILSINPDDHIRNIAVVHENNIEAHDAGQIFNPKFLEAVTDFRSLRFMDWEHTNNQKLSEWGDRAEFKDATWASEKGVPLEVMVELANITGTDPWFTIPHLADEDYIRNFVTYVHDNLDGELKPYFEFSNEAWNWQFDQAQWANAEGRALWPDQGDAWVQFYALKSAEMARIIDDVYGEDVNEQVFKVISTQTGWLGLENGILQGEQVTEALGGVKPATLFNTYAVTGYFGGALGAEKSGLVMRWIEDSRQAAQSLGEELGLTGQALLNYVETHKYDLAFDVAAQELRTGSVSGDKSGSLDELFETFAYHKNVADQQGLRLIMYEGGSHIVGIQGNENNEDLTQFFMALNDSDVMGDLYAELIQGWHDAGGTMFNAFVGIGGHSKWGSWGAIQHLDDTSARWDALLEANAKPPHWVEEREDKAFLGTGEGDEFVDPLKPAGPVDPTDPVDPEPVDPTDPEVPGPTHPEEPGPVDPEDPTDPEVPEPEEEEPETPGPEEPNPVEPEVPGPSDPEGPGPSEPGPTDPGEEPDEEDPQDPETGSGGGCFVATAAYGHRMEPDVVALRRFRDQHLVNYRLGRVFIRAYWVVGPVLAARISPDSAQGRAVRVVLSRAVRLLERSRFHS